jgi:transposase
MTSARKRGNGVRQITVWKKLLGVEHVAIEDVRVETGLRGEEIAVVALRPDRHVRLRCPQCRRKCGLADEGEGRRRWRALDVHGRKCYLEARAPRVRCPSHGLIVASVPWARHGSRFTAAFEDQAAWLCAQMAWRKVAVLLRTTWESLQSITVRVTAENRGKRDRLAGLRRIGIDEKSWGKGDDKYIMVVTDHGTGEIVWAAGGRCQDTVRAFFTALGPERSKLLTHVSADGAEWIHDVIREKAPRALICLDAFHVVKWAGEALDKVRRRTAAELRAAGNADQAASLGQAMWALRKAPEKLTGNQRTSLAGIAADNEQLYRAYLMKEQLREAFRVKGKHGKALITGLIAWARRSRIPEFARLARTLTRFKALIFATMDGGPSNGRAEGVNSQIQALIARARGFGSAGAVIAMAELVHGGLCPDLPLR